MDLTHQNQGIRPPGVNSLRLGLPAVPDPYPLSLQDLVVPPEAVGWYLLANYTPVRSDGETGDAVQVVSARPIGGLPPTITAIQLTGVFVEGETLRASYEYSGGYEGTSVYGWYLHEVRKNYWFLVQQGMEKKHREIRREIGSVGNCRRNGTILALRRGCVCIESAIAVTCRSDYRPTCLLLGMLLRVRTRTFPRSRTENGSSDKSHFGNPYVHESRPNPLQRKQDLGPSALAAVPPSKVWPPQNPLPQKLTPPLILQIEQSFSHVFDLATVAFKPLFDPLEPATKFRLSLVSYGLSTPFATKFSTNFSH